LIVSSEENKPKHFSISSFIEKNGSSSTNIDLRLKIDKKWTAAFTSLQLEIYNLTRYFFHAKQLSL